MFYLILSVLCSTSIIILFRLFPHYGVHTIQAIVFNYVTCLLCGWMALGEFPFNPNTWQLPWLPYPLGLGVIFILTFNIAAQTVVHFGVTITSVMQRMSLLITVPFAVAAYRESLPLLKLAGLLAAVLAILFVNLPNRQASVLPVSTARAGWLWILPFALWLSSGLIEVVLLYVERLTAGNASLLFTTLIFGTAAGLGLIWLLWQLVAGRAVLHPRHLVAGILLGLPNFGSIYFVLQALNTGWGGSVVFPVNNVAVIGLAALTGWLFFRENLSKLNTFGVALAIIAIIFIALAR